MAILPEHRADGRKAERHGEIGRPLSVWSSRPGEFHPEALTDPYVNLSIHTALHSDSPLLAGTDRLWKERLLLVTQLAHGFRRRYVILFVPRPLQALPHYYRMIRHLQVHRYFPFRGSHL